MEITELLHSSLIFILLFPCFSIPILQVLARVHFMLQLNSQFLKHHISPFERKRSLKCNRRLGGVQYEHPWKESKERVECVVCLCNIEAGEEIRELRCQHLFHKDCLDRWLVCSRSTCPLCRDSLLSCEANRKLEDMDDEELEDVVVPLVAYVYNAWWLW